MEHRSGDRVGRAGPGLVRVLIAPGEQLSVLEKTRQGAIVAHAVSCHIRQRHDTTIIDLFQHQPHAVGVGDGRQSMGLATPVTIQGIGHDPVALGNRPAAVRAVVTTRLEPQAGFHAGAGAREPRLHVGENWIVLADGELLHRLQGADPETAADRAGVGEAGAPAVVAVVRNAVAEMVRQAIAVDVARLQVLVGLLARRPHIIKERLVAVDVVVSPDLLDEAGRQVLPVLVVGVVGIQPEERIAVVRTERTGAAEAVRRLVQNGIIERDRVRELHQGLPLDIWPHPGVDQRAVVAHIDRRAVLVLVGFLFEVLAVLDVEAPVLGGLCRVILQARFPGDTAELVVIQLVEHRALQPVGQQVIRDERLLPRGDLLSPARVVGQGVDRDIRGVVRIVAKVLAVLLPPLAARRILLDGEVPRDDEGNRPAFTGSQRHLHRDGRRAV